MPVTSQESERSCIYVLMVLILPVSSYFVLLYFGNVPTMRYFGVYHFIPKDSLIRSVNKNVCYYCGPALVYLK
jgi:hypothetical protein